MQLVYSTTYFEFTFIENFQKVLQNCRMVIRQMSKAFRLVCQENLLQNSFPKSVKEGKHCVSFQNHYKKMPCPTNNSGVCNMHR